MTTAKKDIQKNIPMTSDLKIQDFVGLLDLSQDFIFITNEDGHILFLNQKLREIVGSNTYELSSMFDQDEQWAIRSCCTDLLKKPETQKEVCLSLHPEHSSVYLDWTLQNKFGHILGIGRDYSELRRQTEALRVHEQQLSEAQAMGHMGHWHWDVGARSIEWSEELFRIFGVTREEFQPTIDNLTKFLHRRDAGRLMQGFQRAIIEKKDYEMEFRIFRPKGQMRYVRCEGRCTTDEEGDVNALYGIMQDITERVIYEQELKTAKDSAERAYSAKSQFLANMSHELRTPLNAVIGFSEMMEREVFGPLGSEKYKDYIGSIKDSGEHLLDLITDILDMSKIEAGKYELDLEEIELQKVLKMVTNMLSGRAEESGIDLSLSIENKERKIIGDRRALTQILVNLISNAVKFTNNGGQVCVECVERENYVLLRVKDNGIGIPANRLPYVTKPFEQASCSYSRDHEGSGLGLAITKELVELHYGSLHIESHVGEGTTVSVRLPYDAYLEQQRRTENESDQIGMDTVIHQTEAH